MLQQNLRVVEILAVVRILSRHLGIEVRPKQPANRTTPREVVGRFGGAPTSISGNNDWTLPRWMVLIVRMLSSMNLFGRTIISHSLLNKSDTLSTILEADYNYLR